MKKAIYFWKKAGFLFSKIKTIQIIFLVYISIILIGAGILSTPIAQENKNNPVDFFTSLFTSVSAFSDTGLSLVNVSQSFNIFGQALIAILILVGGTGFFAIKFYFFNLLFRKKLGLKSREILKIERSSNNIGELKNVIKTTVTFFLITILIFSLILTLHFYFYNPGDNKLEPGNNPYKNVNLAFRYGFFHTISALNNAGFDIVGSSSFSPYYGDIFLQTTFIFLIIFGGIGFPVIYDFSQYFKQKLFFKNKTKMQLSLFSKICIIANFSITAFSFVLFLLFEETRNTIYWNTTSGNWFTKSYTLLFHSFSTRSAGFAFFDVDNLSQPSLFLTSILMFIGSSPSSTGGGVRVTTIWILFLNIIAKFRNHNQIFCFKRKIGSEKITTATFVIFVSFILCVALILFSSVYLNTINLANKNNPDYVDFQLGHVIFEVTSAFGTSGLSTGLIQHLNRGVQVGFMLIMLIGQLGISSSILMWKGDGVDRTSHSYISEDFVIN